MTREVKVVSYDREWPMLYQSEVTRLLNVLEHEIVSNHHIGSTAIPGMSAKPIIDILLEVRNISKVDDYNDAMIGLGYEPRGELGIAGRRYFSREEPVDVRTHHIHAFQSGNRGKERHLAFRDYMIAHPVDVREYSQLKMDLAKKFPLDIDGYIKGKESYVDDMEKRAIGWYRSYKHSNS